MKKCTKCNELKPYTEYWNCRGGAGGLTPSCKDCHRKTATIWRANNPEKQKIKIEKKRLRSLEEPTEIKMHRRLKHQYGIGIQEWKRLFESQNGCCAICSRHQSELSRVLQVDHCHRTAEIRGLLCTKCNTKLAAIEEEGFVKNAEMYLKKPRLSLVEGIV